MVKILESDFGKLWTAQSISLLGTQLGALTFTALVFLSAGPREMGILSAASALPVLFFGNMAGIWVDRVKRKPILIAADLGRAAIFISIPLAALLDKLYIEHLYVIAFIAGSLTVFFDIAFQSYMPTLLPREHLLRANSRISVSESVAELSGPGVGGLVVQTFNAPLLVSLDALTFFFSALLIARMKRSELVQPVGRTTTLWSELNHGLLFVLHAPPLRALAGASTTFVFFAGWTAAVYSVFVIRDLRLPVFALGLLFGAGGLGFLLGALFAHAAAAKVGLGQALVGARLGGAGLAFIIAGASGPEFAAFALLLVIQLLSGPLWAVYEIGQTTLRQAVTPVDFLGRVNAINQTLESLALPLGALAGGLAGEALGVRFSLVLAAAGLLAGSLWLITSPIPYIREAH